MLRISSVLSAGYASSFLSSVIVRATDVTKADLIDTLSGEFEMPKRKVGEMLDMLLEEITNALRAGDKVQLIPFGSFVIRERRRREGRNPKTGEAIIIPSRRIPAFQPGKGLREAVSGVRRKPVAANGKTAGST